jgi:hypothetical protein
MKYKITDTTLAKALENVNTKKYGLSKKQGFYKTSYEAFLLYFNENRPLNENTAITGISLAYSWMPTIPNNILLNDHIVDILNNAYTKQLLTIEDLQKLKSSINNSIVGTSKVLHFINPQLYPIWDSKIAAAFSINNYNMINDVKNYMSYVKAIEDLSENNNLSTLIENYDEKFTSCRNIDMALFSKE